MVVDEENLIVVMRSLHALVSGYAKKQVDAGELLVGLQKIKLNDDGSIKTDKDTGQAMTQARRDEIYDKCLPIINDILA